MTDNILFYILAFHCLHCKFINISLKMHITYYIQSQLTVQYCLQWQLPYLTVLCTNVWEMSVKMLSVNVTGLWIIVLNIFSKLVGMSIQFPLVSHHNPNACRIGVCRCECVCLVS